MAERFCVLFLYLVIYSFLGWLLETLYCSIPKGHFVERGFLNGPYCPIYGFGALFILLILNPYVDNIFAAFVLGTLLTSILEYLTGYIMEKLFKMRWWDYSDRRFNIKGRVCLLNSVLFGVLSVILTELIHPVIASMINRLPLIIKYSSAIFLFIIIVIDLIISVKSVISLNDRFEKVHFVKEQIGKILDFENLSKRLEYLRENRDSFIENIIGDLNKFKISLIELKGSNDIDKVKAFLYEKLSKLQSENRYTERRILRSFPKLKSIKHNEILQEVKKYIKEFKVEYSKKRRN